MDKVGYGGNLPKTRITVRLLLAADINDVAAIYDTIFDSSYISYSEIHLGLASSPTEVNSESTLLFCRELEALLKEPDAQCFVATRETNLVGFSIARIKNGAKDLRECWLEDMGVSPPDLAVANALYQKVLTWAHGRECQYIFFESNITNAQMHRVCRRYGFAPICTIFGKALKS